MLIVYRRHSAEKCAHKSRNYRRCSCPLWVDGTLLVKQESGESVRKRYHKSLGIRNWERAQKLVQEMEASGKIPEKRVTIEDATEAFLRDTKARGLRPASIYKYRLLFNQLKAFAKAKGLQNIAECNIDFLRRFRESWTNKNYSARKKLEALRTFFRFVQSTGWLITNPVLEIKPPKTEDIPTLPFSRDEFKKVLAACDKYPNKKNALRLRALVLLLRHSGLRIADAVTLPRQRVKDGILTLKTAKTGTDIRIPLPATAVDALAALPVVNGYYFWSGQGNIKSCVGDYQRAFKKLYTLAEVENGHAHRWRDTFAVELLLADVPLEQVSILLGHQSVRITEKHYAPFVPARQQQLEAAVRRTFEVSTPA